MRARLILPLLASGLWLAACDDSASKSADSETVTIDKGNGTVSGISIDTDDFKANVEIPGIEFNGAEMDIDGMKLPEGSRVRGMRVKAVDKAGQDHGSVRFDFTAPLAPDAVAEHLEAQATDSDWKSLTRSTAADGALVLRASKSDDDDKQETLEYRLSGDGTGTRGTATIVGAKN